VTAHSPLLRLGRAGSEHLSLMDAAGAERSPRRPRPFTGPAFWVAAVVATGAVAGMAFAPPWVQVVLFLMLWAVLFAYTGLSRRGRF
jgi:hypothetical protein